MHGIEVKQIGDAVRLRSFTDPNFKTMRISANLLVPLKRETAAAYALLPSLVTRASREYPDYAALSRKLSELYGASLNCSVKKLGDLQVLTLSAGGIASRYAFGGEDMFSELTGLLFSVLSDPLRDGDGMFPEDGFQQEKRQILEMKDAEFNDKMVYAHQRCEQLLFEGQPAGIDRYGSREAVEALERPALTEHWQQLLDSASFEIFALGDCTPDPALFEKRFQGLGSVRELCSVPYLEPETVRRVTEEEELAQSKLSMGFRVDCPSEDKILFQLMNAVFGGSPSSKLFRNVREKMSLCYYCSSGYSFNNRAMFVESGVETENLEKTEKAVLEQLKAVQEGEITEEELLSAKLALGNAFRSVRDSLRSVETWYLSRSLDNDMETPEEAIGRLMAYTAEDVARAAAKVRLGSVFSLKGSGTH